MKLIDAIFEDNADRVRDAINNGDNVNDIDSNGFSMLSLACSFGNTEIVRMLVDAGADVNDINTDWTTALLIATENGYAEIVEILLEEGASTSAGATSDGLTALDLAEDMVTYSARKQEYRKIIEMLRDTLW